MKSRIGLFFKGMAMGAADVIPGVSGGTIAFITNIYEELIGNLSRLDAHAVKLLLKGNFKALWQHIGGTFLATLFAGIFTSVLSLAAALTYALDHYPTLIWSFFFGLVFASIFSVGKSVSSWNFTTVLAFLVGAVIAYWVTTLPATGGTDQWWYLILCGALAICAMILPGISGSFILLLLGAYATVLEAVSDRHFEIIIYVGIGAVIGLIAFTKLLKWIFEHHYNVAVALLTGFLLGSLNKLWPWKEVLSSYVKHEGTPKAKEIALVTQNLMPAADWSSALVLALLGAAVVFGLEWAGSKKSDRA
jgi:putative membrane protein